MSSQIILVLFGVFLLTVAAAPQGEALDESGVLDPDFSEMRLINYKKGEIIDKYKKPINKVFLSKTAH